MTIPTPPSSPPPGDFSRSGSTRPTSPPTAGPTPPTLPAGGGRRTSTDPKSDAAASRRTSAITVASIVAVSLAALFAVGANLGILNSADDTNVGSVSAARDLLPAGSDVVDVYLDQQGTRPDPSSVISTTSRRFQVDQAGTVTVSTVDGHAQVDSIDPAAGWNGKAVQASGADVAVSFTDGTQTLEFVATANPDATITGDVTVATDGPAASSSDDSYDDSHHYDDHRNDSHNDDAHSTKDHEGGDDDD
ncbi:MAG: hypothetical protein WBF71_04120 [Microthrixaceae bacterium]